MCPCTCPAVETGDTAERVVTSGRRAGVMRGVERGGRQTGVAAGITEGTSTTMGSTRLGGFTAEARRVMNDSLF